jgi:hypothetical protein
MAKLNTKERKELPAKDFAEPKERKFPIEDKSHARNALARAAAKGPEVEKKVASKVRSKYPGIKVGGKGGGSKKRRSTSDGYMTS